MIHSNEDDETICGETFTYNTSSYCQFFTQHTNAAKNEDVNEVIKLPL